jgi:hypothetical protein
MPLVVKRVAPSVATTGLHFEIRLQGHAIAGALEAEIGDGCFAACGNRIQFAFKTAARGEYACDAVEDAQIRMLEEIIAAERRIAGLVGLPRAEIARALNLSGRGRIGQARIVFHRDS